MLDRVEAEEVLGRALAASEADAAEALLSGGALALTRFAENAIHQNVAERNVVLSIRSVIGRRSGSATTNRLDPEGIRAAARRSESAARATRDEDPPPDVAAPAARSEEGAARLATAGGVGAGSDGASWGPRERQEAVASVVSCCRRAGLTAAGFALSAEGELSDYGEHAAFAVANSRGLSAYHRRGRVMLSATAMDATSSGWVLGIARGPVGLAVDRLAETAVEKAVASRDPKPLPPGRYTVVLEPAPVASLVEFLLPGFNARAFHEGRSFLAGQLPRTIGNDAFTLLDDHAHPLHAGKPFDEEGVPRKRVVLVDRGVARALVWDRRTAAERGAEPTGHGLRLPNAEGAAPAYPVVPGGVESVEDLVRSTRRGILVTRLWYVRVVDPMRVIVTAMTRDGTFWIENGRIAHGVRNLRVNESVVEAFGRISGVGREALSASSERAVAMVVPALRIEDFQFTSEASF